MVFNMVMRFGKAQGIGGEQWSFPLKQSHAGERGACEGNTVLYVECEARVKVGERHSEWFEVEQVVRQGYTLLYKVESV